MGKIYEEQINTFTGGISNDIRSKDFRKFAFSQHFDTRSYPHKLVPQFKTEAMQGATGIAQTSLDIVKFLYAPADFSTGFTLYGYGVNSAAGTDRAKIYYVTPGESETTKWTAAPNGGSANDNRLEGVFFYYRGASDSFGYIYMFRTGNLMRWAADGSAFTESYQSLTTTKGVAQPVHHSADDNAYFFTQNLVHRLDNQTWTGSVLTLPQNAVIVSACEYGNYLAIGAVLGLVDSAGTTYGSKPRSVVYLWDRDSSIDTISQKIDFGEGSLLHLANLNNKLIGVIDHESLSALNLGRGKVLIKQASGNFAVTLSEIPTDRTVTLTRAALPNDTRVVKENRLYFPMAVSKPDGVKAGVWVVDEFGGYSLEIVEESLSTSNYAFQGIFNFSNTWYLAHSSNGSVSKTDDGGGYSNTNPGVYETLVLNGEDSSKRKKLIGVSVTTEAHASGTNQVTLKYRKDEDVGSGSWTTIFTDDTDYAISHSSVNIESSGATLPEFKEIQFRIESQGGVIVTGLSCKYEETDKRPY